MPLDTPRSKLDAARGYGAAVIAYDRFRENREQIAAEVLQRTGAVLIPPFDHPMIIAGQGTAALEVLDEVAGLDAIITPVGGGGLLSGCATFAKGTNPAIRSSRNTSSTRQGVGPSSVTRGVMVASRRFFPPSPG